MPTPGPETQSPLSRCFQLVKQRFQHLKQHRQCLKLRASNRGVFGRECTTSVAIKQWKLRILLMLALFSLSTFWAFGQSPNTAAMIVVVIDQTGAVVKDAKVSVVNSATGAEREAVSGDDGSATIPAL